MARLAAVCAVLAAGAVAAGLAAPLQQGAGAREGSAQEDAVLGNTAPQLRITSPLGRSGLPGSIRIVARLEGVERTSEQPPRVEFYVDRLHLADDLDGPPYEALWADDNPFERREITVRAEIEGARPLTATVVLDPLPVTEAVEVTSVAIEASVVDGKGRLVRNLTRDDFELRENGDVQNLDVVTPRREPALFTLLIDTSQSMAARAVSLRAAAARFLEPLNRDDAVIVAPFSKGIVSVTGPTTDHATVLDAIGALRPTGGTAILDSLQQAAAAVGAMPQQRRAIVLITDGYDEHSTAAFDATVDSLRKQNVTVYVIGIGGIAGISLRGERLLKELAQGTGGNAWFPRDSRRLDDAYATAAEDIRQRYLLTYTPSNQRRDGMWRAITLRVRHEGLVARTREGYMAPMAPPVRASFEFTAVGRGQRPATLTSEDLVVVEDGIRQKVDTFQEAVLPVTFMLALDASGSMRRSAEQAQWAARDFIQALRAEDEVGMILFADRAEYIHSPTVRRDYSLKAIDGYAAQGGTALWDAVYDSLAQLNTVRGRRAVVVVTDGIDENAASTGPGSLRAWDEVLRKLQQTEAAIYAVGLGGRVDRRRLQELADRSGGAAYFPSDAASLAADYQKILDELRRRYVVGYESTNRQRDGQWRRVELQSRDGSVVLRSRGGYFAPQQ